MHKPITALLCLAAALALCAPGQAQVTIATVPIGNVGNPADPATGAGAVNYSYSMSTYDVTIGQYTAFLNAVAAADPYNLYNAHMATNANVAGIAQSGTSGNYTYSVIGSTANDPITIVTYQSSARFANWMANGQPKGPEGPGTTETGSYTLNGATTDAALANVTRNSNATWVIPTNNEYYKATYYQPTAQGGPTSGYWLYPDRSNSPPVAGPPPGGAFGANVRNFASGNYALTNADQLTSTQFYLTAVGAYSLSHSFYGTYDQGTLVGSYTETLSPQIGVDWRGDPGGAWDALAEEAASNGINDSRPGTDAGTDTGIRLALIVPTPEPSTALLALLACPALWLWRRRFQ
jgi:formylglycine-generating enzyme